MIQAIGLMVAAYILTRCVSLCTRSGERAESLATRIFAFLTFLWTLLMAFLLLGSGAGMGDLDM